MRQYSSDLVIHAAVQYVAVSPAMLCICPTDVNLLSRMSKSIRIYGERVHGAPVPAVQVVFHVL